MKKFSILTLLIIVLLTTGCLKRDRMEDIKIVTTIYPIEYVTNRLYGDYSQIKSVYPRDSISSNYTMTNKQLKDFSQYDLFIYNGESNESDYATKMLNYNKRLKIIDAAYGLDTTYKSSDIWLNPSNILMIGQNIKNELKDYIISDYIKEQIEAKYVLLKVDITEIETEFKKTAENAVNNKIVVEDESLNFLKKYGYDVINLTENGKEKPNNIALAKDLYSRGKLSYVFVMEHSGNKDIVSKLKDAYNINELRFRTLDTISEKDEKNKDDYLSIMHDNISKLQKETYK
ncbi:MAG: zinc ABC transporter substrate-binding protein [Bacilli bacterium]|nr:zinc ABC transporter substrate-binding protein [Bacilli bacterium]